jgi:hypothetical protein
MGDEMALVLFVANDLEPDLWLTRGLGAMVQGYHGS